MNSFFSNLLSMSVAGGYTILILALARLFLKKAPGWISRLIWLAALFRLLCPVTFSAPVSLLPAALAERTTPSADGGTLFLGYATPDTAPASAGTDWTTVLGWVWLAGLTLMVGYTVVSAARTGLRLRYARRCPDGAYEGEGLPTAFVFGVIRPRICLPAGLNPVERRYILLHEQTHVRQFDPLYKLALWAAVCVHWFNPLCWLMFRLAGDDVEQACDERTLRGAGADVRAAYSSALLQFASGRRVWNGSPVFFAESHTKGRIQNVLNYKKPSFWVAAGAILLALALCVCLVLNPAEKQDETSVPEESSAPSESSSVESSSSEPEESSSVTNAGGVTPPEELNATEYIARVIQSLRTTGGVVSFELPDGAPDGLSPEVRLTARVSDGAGSTRVTEGFPDGGSFETGKTYTVDFSDQMTDGASVSFTLWLWDAEQTAAAWRNVSWEAEAGELAVQPDPNLTTVSAERNGDWLVLTYTENLGESWSLSLKLPESWEVRASENNDGGLFASLDVFEDGERVGQIGYMEFEYYPEAEGETFYRSVYSGLMLGSMVNWDADYTPVYEDENGENAICRVARREGDASSETTYTQGVLAYNIGLRRAAAMELVGSYAEDATLARSIAESARFSSTIGSIIN